MYPDLIDSHCHLDDDRFDIDRDQVVENARSCAIKQIIIPATTEHRWSKLKQMQQQYDDVYVAYGLHPQFMQIHKLKDLNRLETWLDQENAVAVGECGLDFYDSDENSDTQLEFFRRQLDIANNHRLPVIVHARKALDIVLRELRKQPVIGGVVHSFSGSLQQAQQLFDLGFKLGIAATISFERAKKLQQVVRQIDIQALLIESDAPDQPGMQHRGQRNEPAYIQQHLLEIATLKDMDPAILAQHLIRNTQQIFQMETL